MGTDEVQKISGKVHWQQREYTSKGLDPDCRLIGAWFNNYDLNVTISKWAEKNTCHDNRMETTGL